MGLTESGPILESFRFVKPANYEWRDTSQSVYRYALLRADIEVAIIKIMYWIWHHDIIKKTHTIKKPVLNAYKNIYGKNIIHTFISVKSLQTENRSAVNNPITPKVPYYDCQYCLICFNKKTAKFASFNFLNWFRSDIYLFIISRNSLASNCFKFVLKWHLSWELYWQIWY